VQRGRGVALALAQQGRKGARDVIPQTPHAALCAATMPQLRVVHVGAEVTHLTSDAYAHQHDSDAGLAAAVGVLQCTSAALGATSARFGPTRPVASDRRMQP
jgi:hypothetical protein